MQKKTSIWRQTYLNYIRLLKRDSKSQKGLNRCAWPDASPYHYTYIEKHSFAYASPLTLNPNPLILNSKPNWLLRSLGITEGVEARYADTWGAEKRYPDC